MANSKQSIAGVSHGAQPKGPAAPPRKYYPQLNDSVDQDVSRAIQTIFDNLYELRGTVNSFQKGSKSAAPSTEGSSKGGANTSTGDLPSSNFATGIHGILVKAPTDPSSLKDGSTLRYNAKSGQFEFSDPDTP